MALRAGLPVFAKRAVWNAKYGWLGYRHSAPIGNTLRYVRGRVQEDSRILELGCGRGSFLKALREAGCTCQYCGVDISDQAIEHARAYSDPRSTWVVSDIESFRSPTRWDAILLIESVYYVAVRQLPEVFSRFREMLTPDGFVLIRVHDIAQHGDHIDALRQVAPESETIDPTLWAISRSALL